MLTDTFVNAPRREGLHTLQRRGERGARELTTHRLTLSAGNTARYEAADEETVVVLLNGRGVFEAGGRSWEVERGSVFTDRATALLLPPGTELTVRAGPAEAGHHGGPAEAGHHGGPAEAGHHDGPAEARHHGGPAEAGHHIGGPDAPLEALLISTPAPPGGSPVLCTPEDVVVVERGTDLYKREVRTLFTTDSHAQRLMVGETVNAKGHWSSYPPHKHDGQDGELRLEEMYYYRVNPPEGFGLHISYTASGEAATHQVRDGDLVLIPYGYHSVSAPPRYDLYYLWAIAGDERKLAVYEDPAHRWVHGGGS